MTRYPRISRASVKRVSIAKSLASIPGTPTLLTLVSYAMVHRGAPRDYAALVWNDTAFRRTSFSG